MGDGPERREGDAMSRWSWALLGGVVLIGIAASFWTFNNQTNVAPPVSSGPAPVAPAPAPAPSARNVAPSPPPSSAPPAAQNAAAPPASAPAAPPAPTPAPDAGQQAASTPAPAPSPETPLAPPVVAPKPSPPPAPPSLADAPLPPPAPGRATSPEVQDVYAPKSLAQLVGTWAYSPADCDRLFQRRGGGWAYREPVDKFAQAAIVESPKKILLPSAICRIEGASLVEGMLKVSADCEDSISYTPRSVMIALRSTTELVYSASGDAALATTLKKCAP
jgi:hypothetical protein